MRALGLASACLLVVLAGGVPAHGSAASVSAERPQRQGGEPARPGLAGGRDGAAAGDTTDTAAVSPAHEETVLLSSRARLQSSGSAPASPYSDVSADSVHAAGIAKLRDLGVLDDTLCDQDQDRFCPDDPLTRRLMAVWLIRVLEENQLTDYDSRFEDVADNHWQTPYIERLADLRVTVGCSSEPPEFCPDSPVNRGQMASFLTRAFQLRDAPITDFADVSRPGNVHASNIDRLYATEITVGCDREPLRYCPSRSVTRAQMAAFLARALKWQEDSQPVEPPETPPETQQISDNPNNIPGYDPDIFYTEENELSRMAKRELVDKHAADHPWLLPVWNITNREGFEYILNDTAPYAYVSGSELVIPISYDDGGSYLFGTLIHELAHIYTPGNTFSTRPGAVAAAHLYFSGLEKRGCPGTELFADMGPVLILGIRVRLPWYWNNCGLKVTDEALAVATSAFRSEMPQWFYDTFQRADGSLNYEAIWTMVKAADSTVSKITLFIQWENEFGGYCSKGDAQSSLFGDMELAQPWRDGGCPAD